MKNLAPDIQCQALSEYANRRSKDTLNNPPAYFMSLLQVHSLSDQAATCCTSRVLHVLNPWVVHIANTGFSPCSTLGWWNQLLYACLSDQLTLAAMQRMTASPQ